jgi:septal ring factor EnvC (AmiA/AmiB activator)
MAGERDPTVKDMPRIAPTRDDVASYRRRSGRGDGPISTGRLIGVNLILALLIIGLCAAGWFIVELQSVLVASQQQLEKAENRIAQLEKEIAFTTQDLDQSDKQTQDQMSFWESEIRKLWDVTNKRNRQWIVKNQETLTAYGKSIDSYGSELRDLKASVATHDRALGTYQQVLERLAVMELSLNDLLEKEVDGTRRLQDLTDEVNEARVVLDGLEDVLARRVEQNEQAIASNDAWRLSVNRKLSQLEERLGPG